MIYCSLEPGLLNLRGLQSERTTDALRVLSALVTHKAFFERGLANSDRPKMPATGEYINAILNDLDAISISSPPIQRPIRELIVDFLGRAVRPLFIPTGLNDVALDREICSDWVHEDIRKQWIDCLAAGLVDQITSGNPSAEQTVMIAVSSVSDLSFEVAVTSNSIGECLGISTSSWLLPLVADELSWKAMLARSGDWTEHISVLVEQCARCSLGIEVNRISQHPNIYVEEPCRRALRRENNSQTRSQVVEVIPRRAFNRLRPQDGDETIKSQSGMRRLYVKKMNPPVRLHYHLKDNDLTFVMYSNGDHDQGL